MIVGRRYKLTKPAYSFEGLNGKTYEFAEVELCFEILPKPTTMRVFDGVSEIIEPLPDHFKLDDWYLVRNVRIDRVHWVNAIGYNITEL